MLLAFVSIPFVQDFFFFFDCQFADCHHNLFQAFYLTTLSATVTGTCYERLLHYSVK